MAEVLFKEGFQEDLFAPVIPPTVSGPLAADRAYTETQILGNPETFDARQAMQMQGNVEDEVIKITRQMMEEQNILDSGEMDENADRSLEERVAAISHTIHRLNVGKATSREVVLFNTYLNGYGETKLNRFDNFYKTVGAAEERQLRNNLIEGQRQTGQQDLDDLVASKGWKNYGDMFVSAGLQDLTPVANVLTRLNLTREILEASGAPIIDGFKNFFPGEIKQHIREHLVSLSPEDFNAAVASITDALDELEKHPAGSILMSRYNLLEQVEGIFTPEVMRGTSAKNLPDRWFSNLDVALESLFTVGFFVKMGLRSVRSTMRATDKSKAHQLARGAAQTKIAAKMDEAFQDPALAAKFGMEPGETAATMMPRPERMVKDIRELPEGSKEVLLRSERTRSKILTTGEGRTGAGLNAQDQANVVARELDKMDMADGIAVVHPKMSVFKTFDDDSGFAMDAILGKTAEGSWTDVNEAVQDLLQLDPDLELFELVRVSDTGIIGPVFKNKDEFLRAAFKGEFPLTAAPTRPGLDPAYYLRYQVERPWHTVDKQTFGELTFQSGGIVPRAILPPNAKFGDEIFGNFLRAYMDEQTMVKNFEVMFTPFYKLPLKDKKFVASSFEWMEDFGKEHGRAPELSDIYSKYDGISPNQLNGMIALRTGMDTMYELFNRRLYREFKANGFKTALPPQTNLPTFHGKVLERDAARSGSVLDPLSGKLISHTSKQLDDLYNSGGRIMKLDIAVDVPKVHAAQADHVLIDVADNGYVLDELSTRPLVYHPGYNMRFYDDPYYVVKKQTGMTLNGVAKAKGKDSTSEAIWTAGSQLEGEQKIRRIKAEEGVEWEVVRARDISRTESTLLQQQAIHREGRMFWDERNFDRLLDVNSNRAKLEDPIKSTEKGIALAARQLAGEDLMKSMKGAFEAEYSDLVSRGIFENSTMKEIVEKLVATRRNTTDTILKKRLKGAIELVKYFRLMSGVESAAIPAMREAVIGLAHTLNAGTGGTKLGNKLFGSVEKWGQAMDPLRNMRSVAFNAFMVLRPIRQAILQSAQIAYLAPLKPTYVASPKFYSDAYGLRRGIAKLRKSGFDDGYSVKNAAKAMGLNTKEYRKLIKEFDNSGLVDLVDVHSFSGGARRHNKIALPGSPVGHIGYRAKQAVLGTRDWLQRVGFDFGERNNVTFTYNLALRRVMDDKKYKSVLDMTRQDWDKLKVDASNLALGMVRPNNFGYQSGALSVGTQFLSFSHKAILGLLGANPAIKGKDALKIAMGTYLLYGANMFGARDMVETQLKLIGVNDRPIPGLGEATLVDFLSAGVIETALNEFGKLTSDDYKDLDLSFLAPGVDIDRLVDNQIEAIIDQPWKVVFGPFGNIFSKTLSALEFVDWYKGGKPDAEPADKFIVAGDAILMGAIPQYNDIIMSYLGYQLGLWYDSSNAAMPLRPTMNGLIARGLFGGRTREEIAYYRQQNAQWESDEFYNEWVKANKQHMTRLIGRWRNGELTREQVRENVQMLTNLMEEFPEGRRVQVLRASLLEDITPGHPSVAKQIRQMMKDKTFTPEIGVIIDQFPDIPATQREQLKQLGNEAYNRRIDSDVEAEKRLRERE